MRFRNRAKLKQWATYALKAGLILTDAELWSAINDDLRRAAGTVSDRVNEKFEGTSTRMRNSRLVVRNGSDWTGPMLTLAGGIGIGVGLGILLAPSSGEETRSKIRGGVANLRNRMSNVTDGVTPIRSSATGTSGY